MSHPGIELRVTLPVGVVIQGESDWLHYAARFGGHAEGEWVPLLSHAGVTIELRAVTLEDAPDVPDDISALDGDT